MSNQVGNEQSIFRWNGNLFNGASVFLVPCLMIWITGFLVGSLYGQLRLPEGWSEDSSLRDIHFVDHDLGWAVGDRGTILKTEDGGRNWISITTPRDIVWSDVYFLDENHGWIVGGYYRGQAGRSVGVMLQTDDGGQSWKNVSNIGMPFIRSIRFFDFNSGWLLCDSNSLYPWGMLVTSDGGKTWYRESRLPKQGVRLADSSGHGKISSITNGGNLIEVNLKDATGQTKGREEFSIGEIANALKLTPDGKGLIAGEKGLVLVRGSAGGWQRSDLPDLYRSIDWNSAFRKGDDCWVAGAPGSILLRSEDGGIHWESCRTGETTPLNSLFFLNSDRGWAVGDLGKIMSTKDGGRTWTVQRNAGHRLANLNLVESVDQVQKSAIALLSGSFGNLSGVELFVKTSANPMDANHPVISAFERNRQGLNRLGNSTYNVSAMSDLKKVEEQLVRSIRQWKPSMLLVPELESGWTDLVRRSLIAAGSTESCTEHFDWGLIPWQVEKLVTVSESDQLDHRVPTDQFSAALGRTVAEQSRFGGLLTGAGKPGELAHHPSAFSWELIHSSSPTALSQHGLTSGLTQKTDAFSQRSTGELEMKNMQVFHSFSKRSERLARLSQFEIRSSVDEKNWLETVTASTAGMDELSFSFFMRDLSNSYSLGKKAILADLAERQILEKIPQSEMGESALQRLIFRNASRESVFVLKQKIRKELLPASKSGFGRPDVQQASSNEGLRNQKMSSAELLGFREEIPDRGPGGSRLADPRFGSVFSDTVRGNDVNGIERANAMAREVESSSARNVISLVEVFQNEFPDLANRGDWKFCLAKAKSAVGNSASLERLIDNASSRRGLSKPDLWTQRLIREKDLRDPAEFSKDTLAVCQNVTGSRIILDGVLNESGWKKGQLIQFAYDQEYLYLAIKKKFSAVSPEVSSGAVRKRDDNLAGFDRVSVRVDVDHDYSSCFELTVDQRGHCNDAVWRDPQTRDESFDPKWFIASHRDGKFWTVEAAIPLREFSDYGLVKGSAWIVQTAFAQGGELMPQPSFRRMGERVLLFR